MRCPLPLSLLLLAACVGCQGPVAVVGIAPVPPQAGQEAARTLQSRVLPIPVEKVFPQVLGVLMDLGYQVRSANRELGLINIYQSWREEAWSAQPTISLEASLLFQAEGPGATRVRMAATGGWNVLAVGRHAQGNVTGIQPALDPAECRRFLELLEQRLCQPAAGRP
jgi:hypothetical protein